MNFFEIVLLGLALSADAFSVSVSNTFTYAQEPRRRLMLMPLFFGVFQAIMPLFGYMLGDIAASLVEQYAGMVTLTILGVIGINMIREGHVALQGEQSDSEDTPDEAEAYERGDESFEGRHLTVSTLVFQAIATAIDAFAVGVSLRAQAVNLAFSVCVIGLTTALCCVAAIFLGRRLGRLLGDRATVVGGIVLLMIGVRAFLGL